MGMPIVVDIRDDEFDASALDGMFDWLEWVDSSACGPTEPMPGEPPMRLLASGRANAE